MELLLIVVLGLALVIVWNSSRDAGARTRAALDRLEREVNFLRTQVAALIRASAGRAEEPKTAAAAAPSVSTLSPSAQPSVPRAEASEAAHTIPAPVAPFTPARANKVCNAGAFARLFW